MSAKNAGDGIQVARHLDERILVRMQDVTDLGLRGLMSAAEAARLARLFRLLAGPARLRLLHAMARGGEQPVGGLAAELGQRVQAVSNQLQRLADRGVVAGRRQGRQVYYRIVDPRVLAVLGQGWIVTETNAAAARGRN